MRRDRRIQAGSRVQGSGSGDKMSCLFFRHFAIAARHGCSAADMLPRPPRAPFRLLRFTLLFALAAAIFFSSNARAQHAVPEPSPLPFPSDRILEPGGGTRFIGLDVGLTLNFHAGAFSLVQDGILCCAFDGGSSVGTMVRLRGEYYPAREEKWGLSGRIAYQGHGAEFESGVQRLPIFGMNDTIETADFQNTLDVSLPTIDFSGLFTYKVARIPKSNVSLYVSGGLSLSFITSSRFDKTERIIGPSGVRYLDGTTEKSFPDLQVDLVNSTQFGIIGGTGIRYPIRETLFVNWELLYRLPFTKLSPDEDWRMSNILFSAGLSMSI